MKMEQIGPRWGRTSTTLALDQTLISASGGYEEVDFKTIIAH